MIHLSGAVPPDSKAYVTRAFETEAARFLLAQEWVLILGPRQHGKTSALARIKRTLDETGFICAFVDLQKVPPRQTFDQLCGWFASEVAASLGRPRPDRPLRDDDLVCWLEQVIEPGAARVVIMIDESSAIVDDETRNSFFGQIRAFKTASAMATPDALVSRTLFAFTGTFRPETLVEERNSPFNVCRRLETEDLDRDQITELATEALGAPHPDEEALIFDNVGGQPHLVQYLLDAALRDETGDRLGAIQRRIEKLEIEGGEHTDGLFRMILTDPKLTAMAADAAVAEKLPFKPADIDYKYMTVVGLMRLEGSDLVFRNSLFRRITEKSVQIRPTEPALLETNQHFIAIEEADLGLIADGELREIAVSAHNGAILCLNARSYRLCMIGCGIALEAILLDWLVRHTPGALATAVASAVREAGRRGLFNQFETATDPMTWRLVNLMKVARKLGGVTGRLDLPDSLREMRNFVHPAYMKSSGYNAEGAMVAEGTGSIALLTQVIRDIGKATVT